MARKKKADTPTEVKPIIQPVQPEVKPVEKPKAILEGMKPKESAQEKFNREWKGERDKLGNPIVRTPENPGP